MQASDLEQIVGYIRSDNPVAARRVAQSIYDRASTLADFPRLGRKGRVSGTRELSTTPLPFIVVYRVLEQADAVEIVNIIHSAQRWPPLD
ncbi:MAG: type II toxin-antitoxin system RelE/ParE family toxin [Acidobacteriia bacterium]|nr:type II toxin-antitoxin system RelE/ParE family toxin [Terriglobia bacterium]